MKLWRVYYYEPGWTPDFVVANTEDEAREFVVKMLQEDHDNLGDIIGDFEELGNVDHPGVIVGS